MVPRWLVIVGLVVGVMAGPATALAQPTETRIELTIFYGEGCPYCAAELEYLQDLTTRIPQLDVHAYEVWNDGDNRRLFIEMTTSRGAEPQAVPTTIIGDQFWVGFDDRIATEIEQAVRSHVDPTSGPASGPTPDDATVDVPFLGPVPVGERSLVVATLVIGFVDGVNPCSLWVLTMLLALVLHGRSRTRVIAVGVTFLLVTATMYGLYIASFYSALSIADSIVWIQRGVAVIVLVLGALQLADALRVSGAPHIGIADARKPDLYRRMRALAAADRSLGALLLATVVLAVGVSLLETPCTAGLPVLWTGLLAEHDLGWAGMATLFGLYLFVFLIDELLVLGVAVVTMRAFKLQEHHGRGLKLVSGVVMISLAAVLLVRPELMETLSGATTVLAVTAVMAAGAIWLDRALGGAVPRRLRHS